MNWNIIERLISQSYKPIDAPWLESLQDKFNQHHNYYRFLYHLVKTRQPKVALEIGIYLGIGSAYMAAAASTYGGQVIGIDINTHETVDLIAKKYNNYHFILGDSTTIEVADLVEDITQKFGPLGIVYQDSSHHYVPSCREWDIYTQFLDKEAIWICDDITPAFYDRQVDPPGLGMVQYFEQRPGQKRLYRDILHHGNIQGVIII